MHRRLAAINATLEILEASRAAVIGEAIAILGILAAIFVWGGVFTGSF
jgi:hypothetical protein